MCESSSNPMTDARIPVPPKSRISMLGLLTLHFVADLIYRLYLKSYCMCRRNVWRTVGKSGRPHRVRRYGETLLGPARSETPCTYEHTSCGSRVVPCPPVADGAAGRVGKSKDVRRRWRINVYAGEREVAHQV